MVEFLSKEIMDSININSDSKYFIINTCLFILILYCLIILIEIADKKMALVDKNMILVFNNTNEILKEQENIRNMLIESRNNLRKNESLKKITNNKKMEEKNTIKIQALPEVEILSWESPVSTVEAKNIGNQAVKKLNNIKSNTMLKEEKKEAAKKRKALKRKEKAAHIKASKKEEKSKEQELHVSKLVEGQLVKFEIRKDYIVEANITDIKIGTTGPNYLTNRYTVIALLPSIKFRKYSRITANRLIPTTPQELYAEYLEEKALKKLEIEKKEN